MIGYAEASVTLRADRPNMMNGGRADRSMDEAQLSEVIPAPNRATLRKPSTFAVCRGADLSIAQAMPLVIPTITAVIGATNRCANALSNMFRITNADASVISLTTNAGARKRSMCAIKIKPTKKAKTIVPIVLTSALDTLAQTPSPTEPVFRYVNELAPPKSKNITPHMLTPKIAGIGG